MPLSKRKTANLLSTGVDDAKRKQSQLEIFTTDTAHVLTTNQGLQILYEILNERPDAVAERTYAPWVDLEAQLRQRGLPLFSVDNHYAAPDFLCVDFCQAHIHCGVESFTRNYWDHCLLANRLRCAVILRLSRC